MVPRLPSLVLLQASLQPTLWMLFGVHMEGGRNWSSTASESRTRTNGDKLQERRRLSTVVGLSATGRWPINRWPIMTFQLCDSLQPLQCTPALAAVTRRRRRRRSWGVPQGSRRRLEAELWNDSDGKRQQRDSKGHRSSPGLGGPVVGGHQRQIWGV